MEEEGEDRGAEKLDDIEMEEWFRETLIEQLEGRDLEDEDHVAQITQALISSLAEEAYEDLVSGEEFLNESREQDEGFRDRLHDRWGDALDLLELFVFEATSLGTGINHDDRPEAAREQDLKFEALTRLHGRACQIAREVLVLLKSGFPDGAMARWRSLHEVSIVASLILNHDQETANRFLLYESIQDHELVKLYRKHEDELNIDPPTEETIEALRDRREALDERFESYDLGHKAGWIAHEIKDPTWGTLQDETNLDHLAPYYKIASQSLHGGPKGTLDRLGIIDLPDAPKTPDVIPVGPSNAGLDLPAELTAISLYGVTAALVNHRISPSRLIHLQALEALLDDVKEAFAKESHRLIEDERQAREEWANQDIVDIALNHLGPDKVFTDSFVAGHTDFDSSTELARKMPLHPDELSASREDWDDQVDPFVRDHTDFPTTWDFVEGAFSMWVDQNTEFDVDDIGAG